MEIRKHKFKIKSKFLIIELKDIWQNAARVCNQSPFLLTVRLSQAPCFRIL